MNEPAITYNPPRRCPRCGILLWPETRQGHEAQVHPRPLFPEPRVGGQREEAELRRWTEQQRYGGKA